MLCDVCREREGRHEGRALRVDASYRPEFLCDSCEEKRRQGSVGKTLEEVKGASGMIAIIRLDGDDVGSMLDGRLLKSRFGKSQTLGRLSSLSRLLNSSFQKNSMSTLEEAKGLTIFSGGDDVLAITSGEEGLVTALRLANLSANEFNQEASSSAGVAICYYRLRYTARSSSPTLF
jgi:CRISPR/Cas system-associated protein Cas10 (large subunit of type III CRISPR-Cas system)